MVELSGVNSSGIWAGLLVVASHLCLFSFPYIDSAVICNHIDQKRHYFQKDYKKNKNLKNGKSLYLHHVQSFWK